MMGGTWKYLYAFFVIIEQATCNQLSPAPHVKAPLTLVSSEYIPHRQRSTGPMLGESPDRRSNRSRKVKVLKRRFDRVREQVTLEDRQCGGDGLKMLHCLRAKKLGGCKRIELVGVWVKFQTFGRIRDLLKRNGVPIATSGFSYLG